MTLTKKAAVLYHHPCPDGAFAALAAHLYFSAASLPVLFFPNTVYSPLSPDQLPLPEITDLYLLDFVGPPGFVNQISSSVNRVFVLDHHKTAFEALCDDSVKSNVTKIMDMKRSGATIAYDYFRQKLLDLSNQANLENYRTRFENMSRLFEYIEDADLWKWCLPDSKAFSSGLKDSGIDFSTQSNPSLFDQLLALDLESIISKGAVSLAHKQKLIDDTLGLAYEIKLGDGKFGRCLAVDGDHISELRSELGQKLAGESSNRMLRGIGAIAYRVPELQNDEMLKISLRSLSSEDTTPISQEFGGGGHRNASSFMISSAEFEMWKQ